MWNRTQVFVLNMLFKMRQSFIHVGYTLCNSFDFTVLKRRPHMTVLP